MNVTRWVWFVALLAPLPLSAQDGGGLFTVDPGLSIWTIVMFLLVLFILGKFAWRPMLSALDARESGIRESIDEAKRMREEAAAALEQHRQQLADSRRQAQQIIAEAREAGDVLRREIEGKAREEAERMMDGARREIRRERDQALEALRRQSVELALAAAARLLDKKLDGEMDRRLIEEYLDEFEQPSAEA